mmetsp:Transcript_24978/g.59438  ORF Transcript_24978/g.59438 Transcript_24978/m.59438 type:complete len:221 (-) Transcript_24978:299-961(-)
MRADIAASSAVGRHQGAGGGSLLLRARARNPDPVVLVLVVIPVVLVALLVLGHERLPLRDPFVLLGRVELVAAASEAAAVRLHEACCAPLGEGVGHRLQVGRDVLLALLEGLHDVGSVFVVVRPEERDRRPFVPCPSCPADTVHIVLVVVRGVVVHDQHEVLHVETPRRHAGRYQKAADVALEVGDGALAVALVLSPVKRQARVAALQQVPEEAVALVLG